MPEKSQRPKSRHEAVERVKKAETFTVDVPGVGKVNVPRPDQLAFFGGLAALAALQIIEWPVAVAVAVGHILASNHHSKTVQELGEAIETA